MRTVALPSGERVPALGIGTWHMGEHRTTRAEEIATLRLGLDLGVTLIDTAEMYGDGRSEALIGEAVSGRRDEVLFWPMHDLLFEKQSHLKLRHLWEYAQRLELDVERFEFDLRDHVYLQRVREHMAAGEASGVRTAPAFFLDGVIQDVTFGFTRLYEAVRARLAGPGGTGRGKTERPASARVRTEGP